MPYPQEYQIATIQFQDFLVDVKKNCDFGSSHMAYTLAQGVLQAFRRRLSLEDGIHFSNLLPVGLRALFVADWDLTEPRKSFQTSKTDLIEEFQSLRKEHNFTFLVDRSALYVYQALIKQINKDLLEQFIKNQPDGIVEFWEV